LNKDILNTGAQEFISKNINTDMMTVLLKKSTFDKISSKELAEQIEAKKKCLKKLPTWFNTPKIYYPKKLHIEQTSSEITAFYKAQIIDGKSLLDLTGGFGIDSYFFSKKIDAIHYNEIDQNLAEIATYNFEVLGVKNISISKKDAIPFLEESLEHFDWIYVDPSRRNKTKGKVFMLEDCLPDIASNLSLLFERTNHILIKTAPLLDISMGIKALNFIKEVQVVAVDNEVKELLWVLKKGFNGDILTKTINFTKSSSEVFEFYRLDEKSAVSVFGHPQKYLYEPNTAILKSGGFKIIGQKLNLSKLGQHSHLYTSKELIKFPGRRFVINKVITYSSKSLKELQIGKANITTRNFSITVAEIRKKFKIKDGGNVFLFFFKNHLNEYQIIVCSKA